MKKDKWRFMLVALSLMALIGSGAGCVTVVAPDEEVPTSALLTYTDEVNGFSISYPRDWESLPKELRGEDTIAGFRTPQGTAEHRVAIFLVDKYILPYEQTLQAGYEELKLGAEQGGYAFVSKDQLMVGGVPAIKCVLQKSFDQPTTMMVVYLVQGNVEWVVTFACVSDSFGSLEPTLDTIATSFRLLGTAAPTSAFLTYTDQTNGFSIDYPSDWERMPEWLLGGAEMLLGGGGNIAVGFWAPAKEEHGFTPNFTIAKATLPYEQGPQAGYEELKLTAEQEEGYIFISKGDLTISGVPAIKYVYRSSYISDSTTMYVYLVQGRVGWLITLSCAPQSFGSLEPTFDAIANNFQRL